VSHTCHAPGCKRLVPPKMFACKAHWFALPKKIRDAIWREYRPGQENDKSPSLRYMAVQRFACSRLAFRPNDESAAAESLEILAEAFAYCRAAVAQGFGDPLEDLAPKGEQGDEIR
jgi:hypothetical protein